MTSCFVDAGAGVDAGADAEPGAGVAASPGGALEDGDGFVPCFGEDVISPLSNYFI